MNTEMEMDEHVVHVLSVMTKFQSALEGRVNQLNNKSFRAFDEARTVEVTIDGHQWLTDIRIEDGLLRELGAELVGARINEALQNAQNAATLHNKVAGEELTEAFATMSKSLGPA